MKRIFVMLILFMALSVSALAQNFTEPSSPLAAGQHVVRGRDFFIPTLLYGECAPIGGGGESRRALAEGRDALERAGRFGEGAIRHV